MRPLWLVFENVDPFGDDVYLILKHGDDLELRKKIMEKRRFRFTYEPLWLHIDRESNWSHWSSFECRNHS